MVGLLTMDMTNPHNALLKASLEAKANKISSNEAVLESGPQLVLQIYIIMKTGNIGELSKRQMAPN